MPGLHAPGTQGLLTNYELDRDVAGVQGTYGWAVQSGAVTFNAGYVFNVAAVAAGDYTVNGVLGAVYAGGTVTLTTADATNPRVDSVVITSAGAVSVVAGTPAGPGTLFGAPSSGASATSSFSTSGPVPPTLAAGQLEIARIYVPANNTPAMSGSSIIDRRHPLNFRSGMALRGSSTTPTSTTSTSAVDLVTITVNIPVTSWILVRHTWRKQALAAQSVGFGLKLNATIIIEATGGVLSGGSQTAQNGFAEWLIPPRENANYGFGVTWAYSGFLAGGGGNGVTQSPYSGASITNPPPQAAITSVIIRAINNTSSNAAEVGNTEVYELVQA